jgi:hypothetical protein
MVNNNGGIWSNLAEKEDFPVPLFVNEGTPRENLTPGVSC